MNQIKTIFGILIVSSTLLSGCGGGEKEELTISGPKSAISTLHLITKGGLLGVRPSASLGIFSVLYTSQGIFLPVESAKQGFAAIQGILEGQVRSDTDETFALLQEVGSILQVDIVDALNRGQDRGRIIDDYTQSLKNIGILIERKDTELTALLQRQTLERKEKRKVVRGLESIVKKALKTQDYGEAAAHEKGLAEANAALALISTEEKQTKDMIERFEALLKITIVRLQAIENNREILIAGLRVINVPGISDLGILEKGQSWRKKSTRDLFGTPR